MIAVADGVFEEDMAGTWVLESAEGEFVYKNGLARPDEIVFYTEEQHQIENRESLGVAKFNSPEEYTIGIADYFIYDSSNGRLRMHIHYASGHYTVRYIVISIDTDHMTLQTYDKKGIVVYRRKNSSSNISVDKAKRRNSQIYSINGEMITDNSHKGIIIESGKKYIKK